MESEQNFHVVVRSRRVNRNCRHRSASALPSIKRGRYHLLQSLIAIADAHFLSRQQLNRCLLLLRSWRRLPQQLDSAALSPTCAPLFFVTHVIAINKTATREKNHAKSLQKLDSSNYTRHGVP